MDPVRQMRRMLNGYQVAQSLSVATRLGISDLLADGPRTVEDLARTTGTHAPTLLRLLRALATIGIYQRSGDGRFGLTELGATLRRDAPRSVAGWAELIGRPYYVQAWTALEGSVRTGENAFQHVHGMSVWEYRASRPEEQATFDGAMRAVSGTVAEAVAGAYDFGRFGTVVDVGGGHGTLMAAILARHPEVRGVLFDQPHAVADLVGTDRLRIVGGDFFAGVPEGGDAYLLKAVIHDWPDEESVAILRSCRRAMAPTGTLLLVEQLLDQAPDPAVTAFSDLNMLVSPGGRERELAEYGRLLSAAGFRLVGAVPTGTDVFVIEAAPAAG
ncbi:MAG TPA: methyltransferase [Blastococcus sp.]|nr:methyltransferase [Blastococcus sp.]